MFLAHRGAVTMSEFSAGLEISRAAASELVARLREKGLVAPRAPTPPTGAWCACASPARAEAMAAKRPGYRGARGSPPCSRAFPRIDPETLIAFLGALIDELKGRTDRMSSPSLTRPRPRPRGREPAPATRGPSSPCCAWACS